MNRGETKQIGSDSVSYSRHYKSTWPFSP